jgi:hypothetical protein
MGRMAVMFHLFFAFFVLFVFFERVKASGKK